jgi:ribonuclease BN (tRNA processing enzyme)
MKLTVLGAGSAFSMNQYQSNFLLDFDGYKMLFDCGSDIRWAMHDVKLGVNDIDGIYISHLHADHIGGLEWVALNRFFNKSLPKVDLYISEYLVDDLWSDCLKGGLSTYQGAVLGLNDYFNVIVIPENGTIPLHKIVGLDHDYLGWDLTPVQTVHVMSGYKIMPSFGILLKRNKEIKDKVNTLYITADTQYSPYQIRDFYAQADLILEDCETANFKSHVHAHYEDLNKLEIEFKNKMWLYHYNDQPWGAADFDAMQQMAKHDGFLGFLMPRQEIEIN